jgi:hypothetical protein
VKRLPEDLLPRPGRFIVAAKTCLLPDPLLGASLQ